MLQLDFSVGTFSQVYDSTDFQNPIQSVFSKTKVEASLLSAPAAKVFSFRETFLDLDDDRRDLLGLLRKKEQVIFEVKQ